MWEKVRPYIYGGPFLVLWLAGVLKENPASSLFRLALGQMLIFISLLVLHILNNILFSFTGIVSLQLYISSVIALAYIVVSIMELMRFHKEPEQYWPFTKQIVAKVLDRISTP